MKVHAVMKFRKNIFSKLRMRRKKWSDCLDDIKGLDQDNLGPYFTLNVAAAGWHSAALVLINEDLGEAVRSKRIAHLYEGPAVG